MGKLIRISGNRLIVKLAIGKKVQTKAIIPLVLFDLLPIGTAPYAYGAYGGAPYSSAYGYGSGGYTGGTYGFGYNTDYPEIPYPYGHF